MPSMRKLAELAGFSVATVSRALNDSRHVLPETRQHILELAEQLHYRPNRLAHGYYTGKSGTLGFLIPTVSHPHCARMLAGVLAQANAESYHLIVLETHSRPLDSLQAMTALVEQRVEGVLLCVGHSTPLPRKSLLELRSHDMAPVGVDCYPFEEEIDSVHTDEEEVGELAIAYLHDLGHRRIAYVGPLPDSPRQRGHAILRSLRKHGLATDLCQATPVGACDRSLAQQAMTALTQSPDPPTAIVAWDDALACRLMQHAGQSGWHIPRDLSIIGCGDLPIADFVSWPLTTFDQSPEETGREAVKMLLQRLTAPDSPSEQQPAEIRISPKLIIRDSCAPPRRCWHGR